MKIECPECQGKGKVAYSCCNQEPVDSDIMMCPICQEHVGEEECYTCGGAGAIEKEESI